MKTREEEDKLIRMMLAATAVTINDKPFEDDRPTEITREDIEAVFNMSYKRCCDRCDQDAVFEVGRIYKGEKALADKFFCGEHHEQFFKEKSDE